MSIPSLSAPLDTLERIELGEGVEVTLHPAGPLVRSVAWVIDLLWTIGIILVTGLAANLASIQTGGLAHGTSLILYFTIWWGYYVIFEAGSRGATPGKRTMGLRVISTTGGPPTLGAVMLRNIVRTADFMPFAYLTGLLCCLFSRRFQRLGDMVAQTLVVYVNPMATSVHREPLMVDGAARSEPPPVTLTKEECGAIIRFYERSSTWPETRRRELAGHAEGLTLADPSEGVDRLLAMGRWLRES